MSRLHITIAIALFAGMISACQQVGMRGVPVVERIDVPKELFIPKDGAVAYRVRGDSGTLVRGVELPLGPLLKGRKKSGAGYVVYTRSNGRHRVVGHQERGNNLVADLVPGRTYIVARRLIGHLDTSLGVLCKWRFRGAHLPGVNLTRICTQILCLPDRFSERRLFETFGGLGDGVPPAELGGWNPIPRDLCDRCTRPIPVSPDLGSPTVTCLSPPSASCNGTALFNDTFEADTVGSPPSTLPSGPPPGDQLVTSTDAVIVSAASKAARISRGSINPPMLDAVLDTGATSSGAYCIQFTGETATSVNGATTATFLSTSGDAAWRLVVKGNSAQLISGGGTQIVTLNPSGGPHRYRFDVDLAVGTFDVFVDGSLAVSGASLLSSPFGVPARLRFQLGECIVECDDTTWTVDDIKVTKTN